MQVQSYLFFEGRCEEAIEFYRQAVGAEVNTMMRYNESPEPANHRLPPGSENKIIHASLRIGETTLLVSDGLCQGQPTFQGFALSLLAANEAEADKLFNALAPGGQVRMPLGKTFFSPRFGMLVDR